MNAPLAHNPSALVLGTGKPSAINHTLEANREITGAMLAAQPQEADCFDAMYGDAAAPVAPEATQGAAKPVSALPDALVGTEIQVAVAKTFKSQSANHKLTLDMLAAMIATLPTITDKKDGYIIHAGVFPEGARTRSLDNIEGVTMLMRDHDGRNGDTIKREDLKAKCISEGIEVIFWDTHTPDENGTTFRAGVPLKEVLPIDLHAPAQAALDTFLGGGPLKPLPASQGFFCQPRPGRSTNVEVIPASRSTRSSTSASWSPRPCCAGEKVPMVQQSVPFLPMSKLPTLVSSLRRCAKRVPT